MHGVAEEHKGILHRRRFPLGRLIVVYNPTMESLKREHYYEHSSNESITEYLGYSLIFHNMDLSIDDVVRKYYDKDSVERAFNQIKGILDLRPVRVLLKSHYRGSCEDMLAI